MLVCVAGKNDVAVYVLEYLYDKRKSYKLGVLCNRTETGKDSWQRSLRLLAERLKIREYLLEELYDINELIFLSLEFDRIIKPELFNTDKLYNIHFSLLPQYKGMYTSAIPILNGEKVTGVTLHKIDRGIDTGDIIAQKSFEIKDNDTCRDIYIKLIKSGINLVIENLDDILNDTVKSYPQPVENSSYYSKDYINYSNLEIDLNQTSVGIDRQIRAFSFREYQLPKVKGYEIVGTRMTGIKSTGKPGTVIFDNKKSLMLSTIDYNIILYKDRFSDLLNACKTGDIECVTDICSTGYHVNDIDKNGWSPLIVATYNNQIEIVYYLISAGADIYATNNNGVNLLMYAKDAFVNTGDDTLFYLFLKLGLSPHQKDYRGKNLFDYIKADNYNRDCLQFLERLL